MPASRAPVANVAMTNEVARTSSKLLLSHRMLILIASRTSIYASSLLSMQPKHRPFIAMVAAITIPSSNQSNIEVLGSLQQRRRLLTCMLRVRL
jgi:hypothetical protein